MIYFKNIFYHVTLENIFRILNNSVYFQNIALYNEPFIHNYLVTQKIFYCEIIYQSSKRKMCVNFLKYLINFFSTNFIFIHVRRKRSLSYCSKNVSNTIITEKVFGDLRFNLLCYMYMFFILY